MAEEQVQKLTHFDEAGDAIMVDVSDKQVTERRAEAVGRIRVSPEAMEAVMAGTVKKGDVLGVARVAGIMAVKRTAELIPLCHLLPLDSCRIDLKEVPEKGYIEATCVVRNHGKTGVEMEALTGVSVALLTIYDMCKAIDKRMVIEEIHLAEKTGGKSGDFHF
ncbi:MAG: cyclic pyranopterin monophosphate synthase MoaC [Lachnospiraceae bacterium]|nr:cyclic pyranopterin monophosphate synthase MoaC [Lachnospiraceae bacterium]